jgi:AraC-like DNA-binding protein
VAHEISSDRGILDRQSIPFTLLHDAPAPELAGLVERYWTVEWGLPDGVSHVVEVLTHPSVNLSVLTGGTEARLHGVGTERFSYELAGRGRVFGVKFLPGAFFPFMQRPVSEITDTVRPAREVFGPDADRYGAAIAACEDREQRAATADVFLRERLPEPDPRVELVGRAIAIAVHDRELRRVDDLAARVGLGPRALQRLFRTYVGVSPKWVLQRYRLHEAAERLEREGGGDLARLALDLGYFDQAHLSNDFREVAGRTPAAYAAGPSYR